jgi:hypothetical protein
MVPLIEVRESSGSWLQCLRLAMVWSCFWGWPAVSSAQLVPPNSSYEVRVSDYFGQMKPHGYVAVRFAITRFGAQADRAETLYVGANSQSYVNGGQQRREMMTRIDFEPGQVAASVDVNCLLINQYGHTSFVVSRDASMSPMSRRDLIAVMSAPGWFGSWGNVAATNGLGLAFFSSKPALDTGFHAYLYRLQDGSRTVGMTQGATVEQSNGVAFPTYSELLQLLSNDSARETQGAVSAPVNVDLQAAIANRHIMTGGLQAIPDTWLGLSPVDVAFLSVADLQILANRFPARLEVLRQWVVSGGRLVISECGSDYAGLPSILPNLNSASGHPRPSDGQVWAQPSPTMLQQIVDGYQRTRRQFETRITQQNIESGYYNSTWNRNPILDWLLTQNIDKNAQRLAGLPQDVVRQATAQSAPLLVSRLGTGKVVAVPKDLAQCDQADWSIILVASCGDGEALAHAGIGESQHLWKGLDGFEVQGVGKPPWAIFLVLITLFALVVGPLAFGILKRNGRPHLLLAVVPGIASIITFGIVAFSIIQDGLGFRTARVSVTWLDGRNQTALVQTSQAIYAGLAPGRFQLPLATPYYDNSLADKLRPGQLRIYNDGKTQSVSGGRILARTKHQVTTMAVAHQAGNLRIAASADGTRWEATNDLGYPLQLVVVNTPAGLMWTEDLAVGATGLLQLESAQALDITVRMSRYQQAGFPEGFRLLGGERQVGFGRLGGTLRLLTGGSSPLGRLPINHFLAISDQQPLASDLHAKPQRELEWHLTTGESWMSAPRPREDATSEGNAIQEGEQE